jgi:O-antigen/teichoic acid export membrane protein
MSNAIEHGTATSAVSDLRTRVFRGGAALAMRQSIGIGLSVVNVLLVTRAIGPAQYGIFAAVYGIVAFIANAGTWGIDVYLLRKSSEPTKAEYDQAFTLLFATSACFVAVLVLFRGAVAHLVGIAELALPLAAMSLFIPCNLLSLPAVVSLDRSLKFERVAMIELIGQVSGYLVAIPLAFHGWGAWAPVDGMVTTQFLILALSYASVSLRPRFRLESHLVRQMLAYGLSYSGAMWTWQARTLVNPLIVGRFAGAQGVGFVALAIRLVEVLSFVKQATWRLAMAALAKIEGNREKLRSSITEGMRLQAIAVGVPMAVFAGLAPFVLPPIFGLRWYPAFRIFPFIAVSYLLNAMFNLHSSVLFLRKQNLQVLHFHVLHVVVFAGSAALLVPRYGYLGYGWAEVAAFPLYLLLHLHVRSAVNSPDYRPALLWVLVCAIVIVASQAPNYLRLTILLLLPAPLLISNERNAIDVYRRMLVNRSRP